MYCSDCFRRSLFVSVKAWNNEKVMGHFVAPRAGVDVVHDSMTYISYTNRLRTFDNETKTQKIHACKAS